MADLNPKQEAFVREYLVDLNGKQAAIRAGYSPKTAEVQASRLLSHVKVQEAIAAGKQAIAERTGITLERVLEEYARIAFADIRDVMEWGDTVMVPCSPEVAETFIRGDGSEADFIDDDIEEELEGQPHGGSLKRNRRSSPENAVAIRAHTPMALIASSKIGNDTAKAIAEVKQTPQGLQVKMHNKQAALDKLYAHLAPEKAAQQAAVTFNVDKMQMNIDVTQVTADVDELLHEFLGQPSGQPPLDS